ncbi:uncharacterized protein BT62DRAFT_994320 [Guyanagaster necrorhizus]|uniref:Uncharacterized protein n=1 Tax=Guyanagaster necrorhizus TaxID=856835 RepID=A0A9P7VS65_9AGAR|nr:uncharacterized protein BT62DRAFT_994320 [Guyanagaster necrorhizus MCA 3950]KAG7445929.1 hypothetical protein BT62DRAFT_994320 [Guyanagaster necrorhizus MCA 3950]
MVVDLVWEVLVVWAGLVVALADPEAEGRAEDGAGRAEEALEAAVLEAADRVVDPEVTLADPEVEGDQVDGKRHMPDLTFDIYNQDTYWIRSSFIILNSTSLSKTSTVGLGIVSIHDCSSINHIPLG